MEEALNTSPSADPDELEALSRKYSNDVVIILALKSTRWAVFNSARQLCAIVEAGEVQRAVMEVTVQALKEVPLPPNQEMPGSRAGAQEIDLTELGLL